MARSIGSRALSGTRRLALLLALNLIVLGAVACVTAPHGWKDTGWRQTWLLLQVKGQEDSWKVMGHALDYLNAATDRPVYTEMLHHQGIKFYYAPTSLIPFATLRQVIAQTSLSQKRGFAILGIALVFSISAAVGAILARELGGRLDAEIFALSIVATITFYPVVWGFTLGQNQIWIDALFVFAFLAWLTGRRAVSGVLVGLMCLIKPHYGLFVLWAGIRREWCFAGTLLATLAVGIALSLAVFGVANHVDYLGTLAFLSQRGEAYYPNQSINGLLNRILGLWEPGAYNNLHWRGSDFPPYSSLVHLGTLLTALAILGAAIFVKERDQVLGFCIMALSITIASPIAWTHHYGLLLPIYAIAFARFLDDHKALIWLVLSYAMTSNLWATTKVFADTPINFVQSYVLFGALILLVVLYRAYTSDLVVSSAVSHPHFRQSPV